MSDDVIERLRISLADRYRLDRELGSGGMAVVYLADDLKHERQVAIKVLRPELAATLGAERFLREIRIASQLSHPNILPLYDSGEADGTLFYVMPYIEGESLRDRLEREDQLPIDEALRITTEVAEGLGVAHSQGIVHRDIKPENILLSGGHAIVADFGIARAVTVAGGEKLTETGIAVGTPAYMSPEQASGTSKIDARSDIYSLACVLYEMLAGEPPHSGRSMQIVIAKKLSEPTPRISVMREAVPVPVEAAIVKALSKPPVDRYATAAQFTAALQVDVAAYERQRRRKVGLRRVLVAAAVLLGLTGTGYGMMRLRPTTTPPQVGPDPNLVAVMPWRVTPRDSLSNLRVDLMELLEAKLTGDGVLRAVSTPTVLQAVRRAVLDSSVDLTPEQAIEVASGLGAGWALLGQVVVTSGRTIVRADLHDVSGARPPKPNRVSGTADPFILVDPLIRPLIGAAAGVEDARLGSLSDSLDAVSAYLAGRRAARQGRSYEALRHYERATAIDSTFALAHLAQGELRDMLPESKTGRMAWVYRDRLSARDRATLATLSVVGPNYPEPPTTSDMTAAMERAAAATPERPEAWLKLGNWHLWFSVVGGASDWAERARDALDSALALDATLAPAVRARLELALVERDEATIRRLAPAFLAADSAGDYRDYLGAFIAAILRDTHTLDSLRARFHDFGGIGILPGLFLSQGLNLGFVADGTEEWATVHPPDNPRRLGWLIGQRAEIAVGRGRLTHWAALLDSLRWFGDPAESDPVGIDIRVVQLALAEPGLDSAGVRAAERLRARAEREDDLDAICWAEIWQVAQGDTSGYRRAIDRLDALVPDDWQVINGVYQFAVCQRLLEAMVEWSAGAPTRSPALERLDSLMQRGPPERPLQLANLAIARWRREQGNTERAYAAIRRQMQFAAMIDLRPAFFRAEGRLAALAGDTANAIRAYRYYLNVRDDPDPALQPVVDSVSAELAALETQ